MKPSTDRLAALASFASALLLAFLYGTLCVRYGLFPGHWVQRAQAAVEEVFGEENDDGKWFAAAPPDLKQNPHVVGTPAPGITLLTLLSGERIPMLRVIDNSGAVVREWNADWFRVWPDATHIAERDRPKHRPGTHIHGATLLEDGSVIYSYTGLGLVRLDACGKPLWRLPYRTHHSIVRDEQNVLWVPGQINHEKPLANYPNLTPPFVEETLLRVSLEGKVLEEISLLELLRQNDLEGLIYLSTANGGNTAVAGDFFHMNDVEPFPTSFKPGFFGPGDVMVSIRNASTLLVFNQQDRRIKYMLTGRTTRQHDPDFVDGDSFSVFDNHNVAPQSAGKNSRILLIHAPDNVTKTLFSGIEGRRFYTDVMGKHQWLPGGHLLITEARAGHAIELDENGALVWEYFNRVGDNQVGLMEEASRFPLEFADGLARAAASCQ